MKIDKEFLKTNLDHYENTQGVLPEKIRAFGEIYRKKGFFTREELYRIAFESSTRSAYHVKNNPKERCVEVTKNLESIEGDFSKIGLITCLKGFKAPTASCVLTAISPDNHAIVDTRVWASLERFDYFESRKEVFDASDYVEMIEIIRDISDRTGLSTEEVGYALFAFDEKVREGSLH